MMITIEELLDRKINWVMYHRQIESMAASAAAQQAGHAETEAELLERLKLAEAAAASFEAAGEALTVMHLCPTSLSMHLQSPCLYFLPDCLSVCLQDFCCSLCQTEALRMSI